MEHPPRAGDMAPNCRSSGITGTPLSDFGIGCSCVKPGKKLHDLCGSTPTQSIPWLYLFGDCAHRDQIAQFWVPPLHSKSIHRSYNCTDSLQILHIFPPEIFLLSSLYRKIRPCFLYRMYVNKHRTQT